MVRLCSSSLQILECQSSILLWIRSVLSNSNKIGLRNSSEGRKERLYEKSDYYENLFIFCCLYCPRYCVDPIFLKTDPMFHNSSQILPKSFLDPPNPSKILPKSTPDDTKRPFGDYVGPLLEQSLILNSKKAAKNRPRVPRRDQNWEKNDPKFEFLFIFVWMLFLKQFWSAFWRLRTLNLLLPSRRNAIFYKIDIIQKHTNNHWF